MTINVNFSLDASRAIHERNARRIYHGMYSCSAIVSRRISKVTVTVKGDKAVINFAQPQGPLLQAKQSFSMMQ